MKDTLDTLVRDAFSVAGEAPVEHLRFAARMRQAPSRKPAQRAVIALCAVLLLTASAVTAKVVLGYQLLFENGRLVGSVSKQGKGVYILNFDKTRIPENGTPLHLEVRDESGKVVETMSIGRAVPQLPSNKKETK